jgi:hypothetical protein
MIVKLKREGGFAGIPANKNVDMKDLSVEEQTAVVNVVDNPPPSIKASKDRSLCAPDVFSYEIKVKKGAKTVTIKYDDTNIPENLYLMFQKYM